MIECEVAVVGGGPAGLSAAAAAGRRGAGVVLMDRAQTLGGQLVKQTHRFFGSRRQRAGHRGIHIASELITEVAQCEAVSVLEGTDVIGLYPDGVLGIERDGKWEKLLPQRLVLATGAYEKTLAFPGSDLPGICGAGGVQTLMNVHGVRPGRRVLMVGAGNIGLIVAYQLLQAKVEVAAIVEASHEVGGYWVHASKIARLGVPILTGHTVLEAAGDQTVASATVAAVDQNWQPIPGTVRKIDCDAICLAVGLGPLADLMWQAGCDMAWIPELGGYVPKRDEHMESTVPGIYVAGDAAGIEEASSAMVEGELAGLAAARSLGYLTPDEYSPAAKRCREQLDALRAGPVGAKIRSGLGDLHAASPRSQVLVERSL
ncbi:MAG: NAD(P)/FAD-dependent oxidoreductase [Clostridia bacterium]